MQRDQIFIFRAKGSTLAAEQNNFLISPTPNFKIFNSRLENCPEFRPWTLFGGITPCP